jgi:hypothetical protein
VFVSRSYEDAGSAALLPQLSLTGRSRCNEGNRLGEAGPPFDIATSTAAARLTVLLCAETEAGQPFRQGVQGSAASVQTSAETDN